MMYSDPARGRAVVTCTVITPSQSSRSVGYLKLFNHFLIIYLGFSLPSTALASDAVAKDSGSVRSIRECRRPKISDVIQGITHHRTILTFEFRFNPLISTMDKKETEEA